MLFLPEPDYVVDIYHPAKLHLDPISGFVSEVSRIKLFTRLFVRLFFCVLQVVYSQYARTDFDTKYVKRRVYAQGCAFLGIAKPKVKLYTVFCSKKPFAGLKFSLENAFNIGGHTK